MKCKTCEYPLWQMKPGACPECGTHFKPSEFEFVTNSVKFCCPHCAQDYYGTGKNGHLEPPAFDCVKCGSAVTMDEMQLLPTTGVKEEQTEVFVTPWIERRGRSWVKAFFATMWAGVGNPVRTIEGVPLQSSMRRALAYVGLQMLWQTVIGGGLVLFIAVAIGGSAGRGGMASLAAIGAALLMSVVPLVFAIVWIIATHVCLRLTGPAPGGLRRTVHAMAYSSGNNALAAIPCIGMVYFSWAGALWWGISAGFMLAKGHGVKGWRAAVAVATPLVVTVALLGGLIAWGVYEAQAASAKAFASLPASTALTTQSSVSGLGYGIFTPGAQTFPKHMVHTLRDYRTQPTHFLLPESHSDGLSSTVLGYGLDEWGLRGARKRVKMNQELREAWATPQPVHRVGDWVFMYEGQDKRKPSSNLWIALGWPDPSTTEDDPTEVPVIWADERTEMIPVGDFQQRLQEQNQERMNAGLTPVPHPREVYALEAPVSADDQDADAPGKGDPTPPDADK